MPGTFPLDKSVFTSEELKHLGTDLFNEVTAPVDWCTVRQAQLRMDNEEHHDSLLEDIASGRIQTSTCSPQDAQHLSQYLDQRYPGRKERR